MSFKFAGADDTHNLLVASFEMENEDTFHMKNLYKLIHDWLIEEGFSDIYKSDNPEIFYLERILGTGVKEHRIWWRSLKTPLKSKYYRYFMKIDFNTLNMKSIEVMHQGQKMKTDRGDCIIKVSSYLQLDYMHEDGKGMRDHSLIKGFDKLFRTRIYKEQIEAYKVDLYKSTYRLQNIIKQYLKLKTLFEIPKPFHPEKGL